jgi:iron(III) transport system substrate-binding protein
MNFQGRTTPELKEKIVKHKSRDRNEAERSTDDRKLGLSRRQFVVTAGAGLVTSGLPPIMTAVNAAAAESPASAPPELAAARKEGPLLLWHGDQEGDVVEFIKGFTQKTGIEVVQQRLLPGAAWPKLDAEYRTGNSNVDVYMTSDAGTMDNHRKQGRMLRYESPELAAYGPQYESDPPGYWTTYYINIGPMMYDPRHVTEDVAPKTWMDLLDPRWKGQIGFQNAAAGTSYAMWFVLKDILPKDYWDRLAEQKPRGYSSSTQIMTDVHRGDLKIGGRVSNFQYLKSLRQKLPIKMVFPPEGAPSVTQPVGIIATTKRPNAAKIFIDYLLSREGQKKWNEIQGSYSARSDVSIEGLPPISSIKVLIPTAANFAEYGSPSAHATFVKLWNRIVGL